MSRLLLTEEELALVGKRLETVPREQWPSDEAWKVAYVAYITTQLKGLESAPMRPREPKSDCPDCNGTGQRDSGGTQPWGEPISVPCECTRCACLRDDAVDCARARYGDTAEPCECCCHSASED